MVWRADRFFVSSRRVKNPFGFPETKPSRNLSRRHARQTFIAGWYSSLEHVYVEELATFATAHLVRSLLGT